MTMIPFFPRTGAVLIALLCASSLAVSAQTATTAAPVPAATPSESAAPDNGTSVATVQGQLKAVEADNDLGVEQKTRVQELLKAAIAALERIEALKADGARLADKLGKTPARRQEIKALLEAAPPPMEKQEAASLELAEGEFRTAEAALAASRQRLTELNTAIAEQRRVPETVRTSTVEARARLEKINAEIAAPAVDGEAASVTKARRSALTARQRMRVAEIAHLERLLGVHDQRLALLSAEIELTQRDGTQLDARVSAWRALVQQVRQREASAQARKAEQVKAEMAQMPEAVRKLAENNSSLATTVKDLTLREARINAQLANAQGRLKELEDDLASVRQRIELAGFNETLALVLRKQRDALPTAENYEDRARLVRTETSWAAGLQIDTGDIRRRLVDIPGEAAQLLDASDPPLSDHVKTFLASRATELLKQQKEFAERLLEGSGRYIKQLGRLDNAERSLLSRAEALNALIDENLLWIRSTRVIDWEWANDVFANATAYLPQFSVRGAYNLFGQAWDRQPGRWLIGGLAVVALVTFRRRALALVRRSAEKVGKARVDSMRWTLSALGGCLYLSLLSPVVPAVVGWPLLGVDNEASRAIGAGLLAVALIMLGFSALSSLLRTSGAGDAHFHWPTTARQAMRTQIRWLQPIIVVLGFIIWSTEYYVDEQLHATVGRFSFLLAMITLTVFIAKVFSPRGAVLSAMAERGDSSLLLKTRYLWSPAVIVTPLALAALSASGFQYSAMQLQNRLQATAWLIILLIVLSELAMRWVRVTQRRNAFATAVAERAERMRARAERLKNPEEELLHGNAGDEPDVTEPEVSETEVREQIGSVLRTVVGAGAILGVWLIWAAVLPALNVLNEIGLWTQIVQVDGIDQLKAVTIIDVIAALLVAVMAWVSTRNLPGALELAVLNRTTMDSGAKYAFTTLSRYIIAGVGIVTVFSLLGMRWSQLQWLVAALSVGLGFGLQEIVANFVSGVILLFERPIRVGDIVTVGGKEGTVSRIQIRATTLTDWDQKEVVIPNKTFITGEVTNWTLTNAVNRILIPVGVAYGTDTEKAMRLLPKIASDHPRVLADPAPFAAFDGFGDSALNLSLRCYIPNLDGRVHVISELCASIDAAFKDAAISIPFPQRDLHINSVRPLDVRVLRDGEV